MDVSVWLLAINTFRKTDFQSFLSFPNSCFVFRTDTNGKEFSILSTELIIAGGNYTQSSKSRVAANVVWKKNHWSVSRMWPYQYAPWTVITSPP